MQKFSISALLSLILISCSFNVWAVTYTAKSAGNWTDKIWLSSETNTYVFLSSVTIKTGDQIVIDPGANNTVTITGTQTITPKVTVTVKTGTLFFDKPVLLRLVNLSSTLAVNAGAYTDANDSGNNILLTFGNNDDYNGKDFRINGNTPRSGPFTMAETGNDGSQLPVSLISFNAKNEDAQVELTWTTASEKDNDHFTVERSKDGKTFETIAVVKGNGTTNQLHSYSAVDAQPLAGTSYYRLSQTDIDGTTESFKLVAVQSKNAELGLYPNPATSEGFSIKVNSEVADATLLIYNHKGEEVYNNTIRTESNPTIRVDHSLNAGIYWVKLVQDGKVSVKKLVVANN